ncbi:MAG TPA: hypothetical protein VMS64_08735, partial [Candidatus Methylomirabilis sp.]|nr:hypothetical protein [Candidatus Methylomirabilis sp.]
METKSVAKGLVILAALAASQPAAARGSLQEKLAAAKQSAAQNQQALRSYTWIEKTQLSLKGEVKNTKLNSCRYGADGKLQKTLISDPPPPEQKKPGLRGKIVEKKKEEMKEELESASALLQRYVPPDPGLMQVVMGAGKASMAQQGPSAVALKFPDYQKAGDALTLTFDAGLTAMRGISVATYLDDPSSPVTLDVSLQA